MKKVVLFVLLLAAVTAASAHAVNEPTWGAVYTCDYSNYSGNATDLGFSYWLETSRVPGANLLIRSRETFDTSYGTDTYKASWALKPGTGPYGSTIWEFTFNPTGPQCKATYVYGGGYFIDFQQCTDGHTRFCWRY